MRPRPRLRREGRGEPGALRVRRWVLRQPTDPEAARLPQPHRVRGEAPRRPSGGRSSEPEHPSTRSDQLISTSRTPGEPRSTTSAESWPSFPPLWKQPSTTSASHATLCLRNLCGGPSRHGSGATRGRWVRHCESAMPPTSGTGSPSEAGESAVTLARRLGHSSPAITLGYYAHLMPEAGSKGRGTIDGLLGERGASACRPKLPRFSPAQSTGDSRLCAPERLSVDCKAEKMGDLGKCWKK